MIVVPEVFVTYHLCLHQRKVQIRLLNFVLVRIDASFPVGIKPKHLACQSNIIDGIRAKLFPPQLRLLDLVQLDARPLLLEVLLQVNMQTRAITRNLHRLLEVKVEPREQLLEEGLIAL